MNRRRKWRWNLSFWFISSLLLLLLVWNESSHLFSSLFFYSFHSSFPDVYANFICRLFFVLIFFFTLFSFELIFLINSFLFAQISKEWKFSFEMGIVPVKNLIEYCFLVFFNDIMIIFCISKCVKIIFYSFLWWVSELWETTPWDASIKLIEGWTRQN
jgi:hypothetical protein